MNKSKIDPRTKLLLILILSTLAIIYKQLLFLSLIFIISVLIALLMRSNLKSIVIKLKRLLGAIFAIALIQSFFIKAGTPIVKIGNLSLLTDFGIYKSIEFILRLGIIISSCSILTTSTSREIVQALVQLHIPYEIAFMVSIAIRFLPVFKDEMTDMIIAIQLRGIDLKKVKIKNKIRIYRYIFLPIVTNSLIKAKELSVAMEMRGFRAYPHRTSYNILLMSGLDYLIVSMSLVSVAMLIILI